MYQYKKIVVGITFHDLDTDAVKYAAEVSKIAKSEKITFVHVVNDQDVPPEIREKVRRESFGVEKKKMYERVKEILGGELKVEADYVVMEGNVSQKMVKVAKESDADLILLGRRSREKSHKKMVSRIAAVAPCSVLVVPAGASTKISKIMTAVDYSDSSILALDEAVTIAKVKKIKQIDALNIYDVPRGYDGVGNVGTFNAAVTGISYDEMREQMRKHAQLSYSHFITECTLDGIKVEPNFEYGEDPASVIEKWVQDGKYNLLVTGSHGRTSATFLILGSVAEELIWRLDVPILAVRKKHDHVGLLKLILGE